MRKNNIFYAKGTRSFVMSEIDFTNKNKLDSFWINDEVNTKSEKTIHELTYLNTR